MQQRGSKYTAEIKERALAMVASGESITRAAMLLGVPKSTLADWVHTQWDADEDAVAARREHRRASIRRCGRIVDKALGAIDRRVTAAAADCRAAGEGLRLLERAAKAGCVELSDTEVQGLRKLVEDYTGTPLRELTGALREVGTHQQAIEAQLTEGGDAQTISVELTVVVAAGGGADAV